MITNARKTDPPDSTFRERLFAEFEQICRQCSAPERSTQGEANADDFAPLMDYFIEVAKGAAYGKNEKADEVFELAKTNLYPPKITSLAESFGMMIVKIEAREMQFEQAIRKLKRANRELQEELHQYRANRDGTSQ